MEKLRPEEIVNWFFRLNGCLTMANFIVHSDSRGQSNQRTEVDVLAVRFPYRKEPKYSEVPFLDHPEFRNSKYVDFILAEVKLGQCKLNDSWKRPQDKNLHRILNAIGVCSDVETVAKHLYRGSEYISDCLRVRLFVIGKRASQNLPKKVVQLTWECVISFIHSRFRENNSLKAHHGQWDKVGKLLFDESQGYPKSKEFVEKIFKAME